MLSRVSASLLPLVSASLLPLRPLSSRSSCDGVEQVVTTNYKARALGVQKMTNIDEALKQCPELILLPGEDLTPYRDASKRIYKTLARFGAAAERLGMDEVTRRPSHDYPRQIDALPFLLASQAVTLSLDFDNVWPGYSAGKG
jgi:hypothetical protein